MAGLVQGQRHNKENKRCKKHDLSGYERASWVPTEAGEVWFLGILRHTAKNLDIWGGQCLPPLSRSGNRVTPMEVDEGVFL